LIDLLIAHPGHNIPRNDLACLAGYELGPALAFQVDQWVDNRPNRQRDSGHKQNERQEKVGEEIFEGVHVFVGELLRPESSQPPRGEISLGPCRSLPHMIGDCATVAALHPVISLGNTKPVNGL
jgi:hypothetical protein